MPLSPHEAVCKVIRENPGKTEQARKNPALAGWFVGQVMNLLDGRGDVEDVKARLEKRGVGRVRSTAPVSPGIAKLF